MATTLYADANLWVIAARLEENWTTIFWIGLPYFLLFLSAQWQFQLKLVLLLNKVQMKIEGAILRCLHASSK